MSLAILFHFLCIQHVSDINISISGVCDYADELPNRSFCSRFVECLRFGAVGFEWCPCCTDVKEFLFEKNGAGRTGLDCVRIDQQ